MKIPMKEVDYRNRFLIANANIGDIIGKIVPGSPRK